MTAAAVGGGSREEYAVSHAPARRVPAPTPAAGVLVVDLLGLPPSTNHLYATGPHGRRFLSQAARTWKAAAALTIRWAATQAGWAVPPKTPLAVTLAFSIPNLLQGDLDGRLKLPLDAVSEALGVDDRYVMGLTATKYRGAPAVRLTVTVWTEPTL